MLRTLPMTLWTDVHQVFRHVRGHGLRNTLLWLKSRDAPVTFQFLKYGALGAFTTLIQVGLFAFFSHTFLPAHDYVSEVPLTDLVKQRNSVSSNLLAFPFAVAFNYFANVHFVFTPGRHSRGNERLLFLGISFLTFVAGLLSGPLLISRGLDPWIAQAGLVVSSAILNFLCRKYYVFLK